MELILPGIIVDWSFKKVVFAYFGLKTKWLQDSIGKYFKAYFSETAELKKLKLYMNDDGPLKCYVFLCW